jgi:hypothetical protein
MSESEDSIERWKRALLEAQANADQAPNPEIKALYLSLVESYTRLIMSEGTIAAMFRMIEDDPE